MSDTTQFELERQAKMLQDRLQSLRFGDGLIELMRNDPITYHAIEGWLQGQSRFEDALLEVLLLHLNTEKLLCERLQIAMSNQPIIITKESP